MKTTDEDRLAEIHDRQAKFTCSNCGKANNYWHDYCQNCENIVDAEVDRAIDERR